MQTSAIGFTAESRDSVRKIAETINVSWKKNYLSSYRPFTIGVSTIGGNDPIASSGAVSSDWNRYTYTDESAYLLGLSYEHGLKMPTGGLMMGQFDAELDNTSGRFTPRFAGGSSELYTATPKISRPVIINAGFNYNGVDQTIPQFVGLTSKPISVNQRAKTASMQGYDFINYLQNSYLDREVMYTGQRTDQIIERILQNAGFGTAQYNLDYGINNVPFAFFQTGTKFSDIINKLAEAELAHFYQDETGVLRFENRQHWDTSTTPNKIIYTADVIDAKTGDADHIINVVEVKSKVYEKQPEQIIFRSANLDSYLIGANSTLEVFVQFSDPALSMTAPSGTGTTSYLRGNTASDGSGTDLSSSLSTTRYDLFTNAAKLTISNSSGSPAYITEIVISGRVAKRLKDIYYREQDDSSFTAYQARSLVVENDYIQNADWAKSLAGMILRDFAEPENLQTLVILAKPDLQLGDLISWQGRYWRVYDIKTKLDPGVGFTQEISLLQRTIRTYFRIGISTIGGSDLIAP